MDKEEMDQTSHELPHLPHELIVEILSRMPVKSLLKFRCVSKSWLSLISTPQFIKIHLKKSSENKDCTQHRLIAHSAAPHYTSKHCSLQSLLQEPITHAAQIDYPVKITPCSVSIVGSCNGLICIILDYKQIYLWNPTTQKSKKLIDSGSVSKQHSYAVYGFGYNVPNDDYNVVEIRRALNYVKTETKVYSSKTDNWRRIDDFPVYSPFFSLGKYVNGKIHWAGFTGKKERGIVSFDLEQAKYGEMKLPIIGVGASSPVLGVLGRSLCVTYEYQRANVEIWMLKEYGVKESWNKVLSFPSLGLSGPIPLCISREGEILMQFGSVFKLYSLQDDSERSPKSLNMDKCFDATIYVESLVSANANDEEGRQPE